MSFHAIHFPGAHHAPESLSSRIAHVAHAISVRWKESRKRRSAEAAERKIERARARDAEQLCRLAKQYEALSPNLAAELRFFASR
jgi:hypothetical protein